MIFYVVNEKFNNAARKAFFAELSKRLEYMAEDLREDTADTHFEEMADILAELRSQARQHRVSNYPAVKIDIKANDEVEF